MRLGDLDALKKAVSERMDYLNITSWLVINAIIDNAPTVDTDTCEGCPYCPPNNGIPIGVE